MLFKLKVSLLRSKPKFAYTTRTFQKCRTITKLAKRMHALNTKNYNRLNALITKSLMSALFNPTGHLS